MENNKTTQMGSQQDTMGGGNSNNTYGNTKTSQQAAKINVTIDDYTLQYCSEKVQRIDSELESFGKRLKNKISVWNKSAEEIDDNFREIKRMQNRVYNMLNDLLEKENAKALESNQFESQKIVYRASRDINENIKIFEEMRDKFKMEFDKLGSEIDEDEDFYQMKSDICIKIYDGIQKGEKIENIEKSMIAILQRWEIKIIESEKESINKLILNLKENYESIFSGQSAERYPKYELIFPKKDDVVIQDYELKRKIANEKVKCCIFPGIMEIQRNCKGQEKVIFRVKPWVY